MDTLAFLDGLRNSPEYRQQIVHRESIPPRQARYAAPTVSLAEPVTTALETLGLLPLYSHQARAIDLALTGANVAVSTSAASGKTLCYNVPVVAALARSKSSRALYLFPTKALAQDQLNTIDEVLDAAGLRRWAATFDGDTPQKQRAQVRRSSRIVLSNPDMLHLGILPNHRSWMTYFSQLKYVIIDEAHAYRGIFGSHVANILRRLRRICARYGSNPQFICCSATIANPGQHAQSLTGVPFDVVTEDGSAFGGKDFICWNPPIIDEAKAARRSSATEATNLLTALVIAGIRSLAFARSRRLVELIYIYVRRQLESQAPELADLVRPYRAGYQADERRRIERELFSGRLLAAIATNALELGVDIGQLDVTIITGYPGSIASTWQQAGRGGRRGERSMSFLIGSQNPLDQYIMRHPEALFGKEFEHALVSPTNPHVLRPHLVCAAWELPLSESDRKYFGDFSTALADLESQGLLRLGGRRWYPSPTLPYPAQQVNIRSSSDAAYSLVDTESGQLLETVESTSAFFQIHPGAIYLHQGEAYLVTNLDLVSQTAYAVATDAHYYTQAKELTDLTVIETFAEKSAGGSHVYLSEVDVTTVVVGFRKKRIYTEEVIGEEPLDLPPQSFRTVAFWFDMPKGIEATLGERVLDLAGGLHATEHAAIGILPLFALCDRNDIGGVSTTLHPDTNRAQIFIYDAHPGGVGIAEKGFELAEDLWRRTLTLITECPCEGGCPSCVQSPKCGNNNEPLDKEAARVILQQLAGYHRPNQA